MEEVEVSGHGAPKKSDKQLLGLELELEGVGFQLEGVGFRVGGAKGAKGDPKQNGSVVKYRSMSSCLYFRARLRRSSNNLSSAFVTTVFSPVASVQCQQGARRHGGGLHVQQR